MIEIKFRAWDTYQNKMLDWSDICDPTKLSLSNLLNGFIEHIKPMQFTGLKDKNGKEIYEGDILAPMDNDFRPEYKGNWTVIYDGGTFAAEGNSGTISTWLPYWVPEKQVEIIGNIYENKELLK